MLLCGFVKTFKYIFLVNIIKAFSLFALFPWLMICQLKKEYFPTRCVAVCFYKEGSQIFMNHNMTCQLFGDLIFTSYVDFDLSDFQFSSVVFPVAPFKPKRLWIASTITYPSIFQELTEYCSSTCQVLA